MGRSLSKMSVLVRLAFGASSEKAVKPARGEDEDDPTGASPGGQAKHGRRQRRGAWEHGRRDYSHLPTREEIYDVIKSERVCPRSARATLRSGKNVVSRSTGRSS